jgi:glycine/D-amino acid oxidase-like deaminating enzyme
MKVRSANAFWLLKNGLINSYPSLHGNFDCDVLVVGGGITGALLAFQMSSEGYKTVLIDRGDVAFGSTSATTAMLQYELDRPLYSLMEKLGNTVAVDVYQAGVDAIRSIGALVARLGIDCAYRTKDSVYFARNEKDLRWLQREFHARQGSGLDVHWLSENDLFSVYGVKGYGGIRSSAGADLDAYRLAHGLMLHAQLHYDLHVYDHTALAGVEYGRQQADARTAGGHMISAKRIIYATGYETQAFMKEKIVDLFSTYVCISEPMLQLSRKLDETIFWTTDSPYLYIRATSDNRVLVGGGDEPFINAALRDKAIEEKEGELLQGIKETMPGVEITPDFSWAGTFGVTRDSLPYIGPHEDFPHSFFVLGYGGNGITFSVLAMKVISDAIAGRQNRFLDYFRFNRY